MHFNSFFRSLLAAYACGVSGAEPDAAPQR
jgi:hypothetical protein